MMTPKNSYTAHATASQTPTAEIDLMPVTAYLTNWHFIFSSNCAAIKAAMLEWAMLRDDPGKLMADFSNYATFCLYGYSNEKSVQTSRIVSIQHHWPRPGEAGLLNEFIATTASGHYYVFNTGEPPSGMSAQEQMLERALL